jgi:hypothetical protein
MVKGSGSGGGGGGHNSSSGGGNKSTGSSSQGAPQQTQSQINHARESNPNSPAYWETRQLEVPGGDRVAEAARYNDSGK